MSIIKLVINYFLQWTWGILQNLIGLIMRAYILSKDSSKDTHGFYGAQVTEWTKVFHRKAQKPGGIYGPSGFCALFFHRLAQIWLAV